MLKEFQEFISKGNVMDLAVGVIIGAAFSKIVDSLVNDIIMPWCRFLELFLGAFVDGDRHQSRGCAQTGCCVRLW